MQDSTKSAPREASKLIVCMMPDDGSHKALLKALRHEKQITRADVVSCLAVSSLADANIKPGTLPDAFMARLVSVVVPEAEADAMFEFIYEKGRLGRDGGGVVFQHALATATPFTLPEGVAEEKS
jgi:hypothetical protein